MANTARMSALGAIVTMVIGASSAAASGAGDAVVARMVNLSEAPASEVQRAEAMATAIYKDIGVSLVWIGETDKTPVGFENALQLRVALLSAERTERLLDQHKISTGVLGVAPHNVPAVYVFCRRVELKAAAASRSFENILGRVLAHEIGHQLLPGQGHSRAGIMRLHLEIESPVVMGFTGTQATSIHARLRAPHADVAEVALND